MSENFLNLDPSARVPMKLRQGKSFGFKVIFEEPPPGVWDMTFSHDEAGQSVVLRLTAGNGFTLTDVTFTVVVTTAMNKMKPGPMWFRGSQTSGSLSILAFIGPVTVLP